MCSFCKSKFYCYGSVVNNTKKSYFTVNADPILKNNAIHWVFSNEVYSTVRRLEIEGWHLIAQTPNSVMYLLPSTDKTTGRCIVSFRGTTTLNDIKQDIKLSIPGGNGCNFDSWKTELDIISEFLDNNPEIQIQLTGHSLGGAIARCVGQHLNLGIVTFNSAAPPSNPVITGPNEIDYHIVFDLISAWQSPNTFRMDKGFRPQKSNSLFPFGFIKKTLPSLIDAHSIDNFSNSKPCILLTSYQEMNIIEKWYSSLPKHFRNFFLFFIGTNYLPPLNN